MEEISPSFIDEANRLIPDPQCESVLNNNSEVGNVVDMASSQDAGGMDYQTCANKRGLEDAEEGVRQPGRKYRFKVQGSNDNGLMHREDHGAIAHSPNSDSQSRPLHTSSVDSMPGVLLIKPTSDNCKDLINNPLEIISVIKASKFGKLNIDDITTNKRKGLLVAKIKNPTQAIILELLAVKTLGKWPVTVYVPNRDRFRIGVISPVSATTDIGKLKEAISMKYKLEAIERLNRYTQDRTWIPSVSVKLVFDEPVLPSEITVGHSFYKVRPYINQPVQCYRCQRIGHTAHGCRSQVRCMVCGGEHAKEVCPSQSEKCANCKGHHKANSKECTFIKQAMIVEKERVYQSTSVSMSQGNSFPVIRASNNFTDQVPSTYPGRSYQQVSYSDRVKGNHRGKMYAELNSNGSKVTRDMGTQTESLVQEAKENSSFTQGFCANLKKVLIEIFTSMKDGNFQEESINAAVDNNFPAEEYRVQEESRMSIKKRVSILQ